MLRISFLALALFFVSGCSLFGDSGNSELDDARSRWTQAGIDDYDYTLTVSCFCTDSGTFLIEVRNGEVVNSIPTNGGMARGGNTGPSLTINGLFGVIAEAYALDADEVTVSYDPALGFPTSISIDYTIDTADDEILYRVEEFVRAD